MLILLAKFKKKIPIKNPLYKILYICSNLYSELACDALPHVSACVFSFSLLCLMQA